MKVKNFSINKIKAVLYDIDGTLLDTFPMNFYPLMRIIKEELDEDWTYEDVLKFAPYPGMVTMHKLKIKDPETVYDRWVRYVNEYDDGALPYDGVDDMIKAIDGKVIQGIVSSKKRAQYLIDMKDYDQYMAVCVLEEDTINHKPDPEPLLKAVELLQLKPDEIMFVGDALSDQKAARQAGVYFGHALWGSLIEPLSEADVVFETPQDIITFLTTSLPKE